VPDESLTADERKDKAGACKQTGDIDRFDAESFVRKENWYGAGNAYEQTGDNDRNLDADAVDPFADMNRNQRGDRRINRKNHADNPGGLPVVKRVKGCNHA